MATQERRTAIRVPARLAMQVKLSGAGHAPVDTINVSASGVYFTSTTHIPVLTKVGITLLLPIDGEKKDREVSVEAVVVRTEPEQPEAERNSYEVACYFTNISRADQQDLESYILRQLAF